MKLRLPSLLLAAVLCALLAACGFQLRGSATLPFKTLWVSFGSNSPLGNELKRNIRSGTGTEVVDDPKLADAKLEVLEEVRQKDILSLNSSGQVSEYVLRYRLHFRIVDAKGHELIAPTQISLKRDISFNNGAVLAKESEEALLYRDMQSDLVQQLLRRMAAIHPDATVDPDHVD